MRSNPGSSAYSLSVLAVLLLLGANSQARAEEAFDVLLTNWGEDYSIVRYMPATGETWTMKDGAYVRVKEPSPISRGHYKLVTTTTMRYEVSIPPISGRWQLVRINTDTGETWYMKSREWAKVPESDE